MTEGKWRSVEQQMWKPVAEGDTIEGVYLGREDIYFGLREVKRYYIGDGGDNKCSVLGTTVLDRLMDRVPRNSRVRITYLGEGKTTAGRRLKLYKVEVPAEAE